MLSKALNPNQETSQKIPPEILNFLLAQRYVEANQKLGESNNSKVVFMDPKFLSEGLIDLMETNTETPQPPKKRRR